MSPLEDNYDLGDHEMNDFLTKQKSKDRLIYLMTLLNFMLLQDIKQNERTGHGLGD